MIKLADILREMAISNAAHDLDRVIEAAKKMGEANPVLWRGMTKVPDIINYVTAEDDRTFSGMNQGAVTILANIGETGVKHPVFAHFDKSLVEFFGKPCVLVLEEPYTIYQSPEVDDIKAYAQRVIYSIEKSGGGELRSQIGTRSEAEIDKRAKEGAATYKKLQGKPLFDSREVIIDVEKYWAITNMNDVKTYADVIAKLEQYKKQ